MMKSYQICCFKFTKAFRYISNCQQVLPIRRYLTFPTADSNSIRVVHSIRCFSRSNYRSTNQADCDNEWAAADPYKDPTEMFRPLLQVPLFPAEHKVFNPTSDEILKADSLFRRSTDSRDIGVLRGIVDLKDLPEYDLPEVCFLGQSNVGKSSLIKSILFNPSKIFLPVSKKPGRTTTLNLYQIGKLLSLVDMPGYGQNMPDHYVQSVEKYIQFRKRLVCTFLLLDGSIGITKVDRTAIEMMEEFRKPYVLVLTKIDLKSRHVILRNLLEINKFHEKKLRGVLPQTFLVSSKFETGLPFLRTFIAYVTGNATIKHLM